MRTFLENIKAEPVPAIAIILTVVLAIAQSGWLEEQLSEKVQLNAFYYEADDGRYSLGAFPVDNFTNLAANGLRIKIISDWFAKLGRADLGYEIQAIGLIGPGEKTSMKFRNYLNIPFLYENWLLSIPVLMPREHIDFFRRMSTETYIKDARQKQAGEAARYRYSPRIGNASHAYGVLL